MDSLNYNNRKLRIGAALVASVYIVLHGRLHLFLKAITSMGFYVAVAASFVSAMLLTYLVHKITIWLDKHYNWRSKPVKRSLFQLVCGIIMPSILDVALMSIYFKVLGENIFQNDFFLVDFPIIVALITILNLYYLIHFLLLTEPKNLVSDQDEINNVSEGNNAPILTIQYSGQNIVLEVSTDVLFFYRSGRLTKVVTITGNEYPTNYSLVYLAERFQSANFSRINRSVIINRNVVTGYVPGVKRDTIQVNFKPQYYEAIQNKDRDLFRVTKENIVDFKSFFTSS
ncbi:LytTR family DNA-binding domain-containing protein [Chryseobacterium sp. ISL-6]|uniref:LytTR family DNA-binding domain-containing protein n=1 Tax=Chryseobacterium sp. ISL-6 TaxID=2819143 RepID=UPI001BEA1632|nr:LytTR family DNA-binding domain-containing protein [Chryseobacterium sp. ISL-6]MBT2621932.1 LytTR family transcriptional regulator [Chryseobacterium sp. ISL-6]